jgi:tetratricopeptide (TPR) repeat protein
MSRFNNLELGNPLEERSSDRAEAKDASFYLAEADKGFMGAHFEEALRAYAKVLEFDPQCARAWTGQVRMLIELGEVNEAKLWADKALGLFPNDAELLAAKAVALARAGDLRAALTFSDAAVETHGNTPYVWVARGDVLLARSEKRAEFCFEKALVLAAHDWFVHWLVSRIYYFYQKFSRGLRAAQKALDLDASRASAWLQYGRCQLALGLSQAATNSFEHARELDPACQPASSENSELLQSGLWTTLRGWWRRATDS